jgi:hypothetical protein
MTSAVPPRLGEPRQTLKEKNPLDDARQGFVGGQPHSRVV